MVKTIQTLDHFPVFYSGLDPEAGALPAFIYFALSGEESLTLSPYNHPAISLKDSRLRIFSFTIPGHGDGFNKFHAMQYWAEKMSAGEPILETFFQQCENAIQWLIEQDWIDPNYLAAGGLSRGGFIATHIAARMKEIKFLLGFAPLTDLSFLSEFESNDQSFSQNVERLNLLNLTEKLLHLNHLRFYIGNRDERVGTDICYRFIRELAEKGHEHRKRKTQTELFITQSVGHKGHGTAPHIFEEGSHWLKQKLLEESDVG